MATIIDALVVTLGLDPKGYQKGAGEAKRAIKTTRDESLSAAKEMEAAGKRAANYFTQLRNESIALFTAFTGASSLFDFAKQLVTSAADAGRLSTNIGVATPKIAALEGVVKGFGGQAGDADTALKNLSKTYYDWAIMKNVGNVGLLRSLGITNPEQLKDPIEAMKRFAAARDRMSAPEFYARMSRLGIPDSVITSMQKGGREFERLLATQEKLHPVTDRDAAAAQALESRYNELVQQLRGEFLPVLTQVVEFLNGLLGTTNDTAGSVDTLSGSATNATNPLGLLGDKTKKAGDSAKEAGEQFRGFFDILRTNHNLFTEEGRANVGNWVARIWNNAFGAETAQAAPRQWGTGSASSQSLAAELMGVAPPTPGRGRGATLSRGGGGGGSPAPGRALDASIAAYMQSHGLTAEQARGVAAGIKAEGGSLRMAKNGAFGLGQWRGPRQRELFRRYGLAPTRNQQLDFLAYELHGGDKGGASVLAQRTAQDTLSYYIGGDKWGFMRPGAGPGRDGDMRRGMAALGYAGQVTRQASRAPGGSGGSSTSTVHVGTIVVNTAANDAKGIARDIHGALRQRTAVNQANRGTS